VEAQRICKLHLAFMKQLEPSQGMIVLSVFVKASNWDIENLWVMLDLNKSLDNKFCLCLKLLLRKGLMT